DFNTMLAISEDDGNGNVVFTLRYDKYSANYHSYSLRINDLSKNQLQATDFKWGNKTENQTIEGTSNDDDLFGSLGNDTILGNSGDDRLFGDQGNDLLRGGLGSDSLFGGEGNDLFVLEYFDNFSSTNNLDIVADFVQGEDKIDVSHLGISDFNTMLAISEDDINGNVVFSLQYSQSSGNFYRLRINGLSKNQLRETDFKFGNNTENQTISGTFSNDYLFGSLGDDVLVGGDGNDVLFGDQGTDILAGSYNSDVLFGGEGNDSFVLQYFKDAEARFIDLAVFLELEWETPQELFGLIQASGFDAVNQLDVVADFVLGEDKIDVSLMGISDFNTIIAIAEDDENGNVVFKSRYFHRTDDDFYALRINGVSKNQLQPTDFVFSNDTEDQNLEGTIYQDDLFGGLGNDVLTGGLAVENVSLIGNPGVNRLFGGAGVDTATFSSPLANYNIQVVGNALRVQSLNSIDLLYDIEQLQFADQTIANPVNTTDNNPPVIGTPINDFEVEEDADNTIIDLTNVFNDADNDEIVATIFANSNPNLVDPIINGNNLILNYQKNQSGTAEITVRGTANGQFIDEVFTVTVNEVNDVPTDLTISDITINENEPINTTVGTFNTTDPDTEETFTYRLVAGDGDTDNDLFIIEGNTLRTNTIFDFETENTYSIRVETSDSNNNTYAESITISIEDVNETMITLDIDGNAIVEQQDYSLINLYSSNLDAIEFDFLINNFANDLIGDNASRADASSIVTYLNEVGDTLLDIDGNNQIEQQDYSLINLYASQLDVLEFGFLVENFANDLIGENATRTNADSILAYFETIVPETV
ncbi:M10 family metallopeptidase C-terminal domain-containing protein, partial [Crocosphaera sp.]|uniref:M10 family metallopeptidase C-terminal domain-containing protein n=1 Tax=Crocosphaera sp. TaxID=2729996 RepID=UPI003F232FB9